MSLELLVGDCVEVMAAMPEASVDAVVCDPPYGLGFMGREWDTFSPEYVERETSARGRQKPIKGRHSAREGAAWSAGRYDRALGASRRFQGWSESWAAEALRVLKPGGHLVAFGGTRTFHRLTCGIEDAGFEIRDEVGDLALHGWIFGSGFPKSRDQGKDTDALLARTYADHRFLHDGFPEFEGLGTTLKPSWEPIVLARKPLDGTIARNVLAHGTGALNIDATRIGMSGADRAEAENKNRHADFGSGPRENAVYGVDERDRGEGGNWSPAGRWPANVVLDEQAAALLDAQVGESVSTGGQSSLGAFRNGDVYGAGRDERWQADPGYGDRGGPSRFFYTAKASRSEREAGLDGLEPQQRADGKRNDGAPGSNNPRLRTSERRNDHPTVKPLDLMQWLVRLVTPPGGTVLDPFLGSGTTGMAALDEGFDFIGIDQEAHYVEMARQRIEHRHLLESKLREPTVEQLQGTLL